MFDKVSESMSEISIHALLAESDAYKLLDTYIKQPISIHALLAESDLIFTARHPAIRVFLSTLSLRRATLAFLAINPITKISIHALLAESDIHSCSRPSQQSNFYPRSPCGERPRAPSRLYLIL